MAAITNYITGLNGTDNTTYYLNEGVDTRFFRGTCSTAKGTAAKTATLDDSTNFSLTAGVKVAVTFINGSDITNPGSNTATLNINNTGAKTIGIWMPSKDVPVTNSTTLAYYDDMNMYAPVAVCQPYGVLFFIYDGVRWLQITMEPMITLLNRADIINHQDRLDTMTAGDNAGGTIVNVKHGGTGATTFTSGALLIGNGTSAVGTRAITNNTTNAAVGTGTNIPTMNTIYYGLAQINGASQNRGVSIYAPTAGGTSGYYLKGAGTTTAPTWQAPSDSSSASAISTGTALATERDIYYGLPTINGVHNYTSNTTIYAPTTAGDDGQTLISNGEGVEWGTRTKVQIVRW